MEGRPEDDSELFTRAQRGDTAAYEEIVLRYQQVAFWSLALSPDGSVVH